MEVTRLPLSKVALNTGQIEGLPANPRQWTQTDIDTIAASLNETPELFEMRPLIVARHESKYIILAGSLRFCGARKNGAKEVPAIVVPAEMSVTKMREIVIKDNGAFGAWDYDALGNEWDDLPLTAWGVPAWQGEDEFAGGLDHEGKDTARLSDLEYNGLYYEPTEKPTLRLEDCIDLQKFNAKIEALDNYDLSEEQKEVLRLFAYRFIKIDFEAVANYYAFNASEQEKQAIERLRLVLVDGGGTNGLEGYIEDDLLRIAKIATIAAEEEE